MVVRSLCWFKIPAWSNRCNFRAEFLLCKYPLAPVLAPYYSANILGNAIFRVEGANYVGIGIEVANILTSVNCGPRAGFEDRVIGTLLCGSNISAVGGYTHLEGVALAPNDVLTNTVVYVPAACGPGRRLPAR